MKRSSAVSDMKFSESFFDVFLREQLSGQILGNTVKIKYQTEIKLNIERQNNVRCMFIRNQRNDALAG